MKTRAESALATTMRLAEAVNEEKRLTRVLMDANCYGVDGIPHLTAYFQSAKHVRYDIYGEPAGPGPADLYAAVEACPICLRAYEAVQARRAVRRKRGALRAALVRIGRLALKEA